MSRVSGSARKTISIVVAVVFVLLITLFVVVGNRTPSAAPVKLSACTASSIKGGTLQNGLWTDDCAGNWVETNRLFRREGQAFVIARHMPHLMTPLPISMAYYDLDVTDSSAYDPGATNSLRRPALTPVFYYDGSQELRIPFPPAEASKTCRYRVVVFVGFDPKGSEMPEPGKLTSTSDRVLGMADHTSDPEVQERCNPPSSRVRTS